MKILKKIILFASFLFLFYFSSNICKAQDNSDKSKNFQISIKSTYTISENGNTHVTYQTQVKNKTQYYYMPSYSLETGIKNIKNIQTGSIYGIVNYKTESSSDTTTINLTFPKNLIGMDKTNIFNISFDSDSVAKKIGNIWEINIPGLVNPEDFYTYDTIVNLPKDFGEPSIVKPQKTIYPNNFQYVFNKNEIGKAGIYMIFGSSQYYKFNILYHISNPNFFPAKTEIALPPDTNYQNILIKSIKPEPYDVYQDIDGNWLASYNLAPAKKQTIELIGIAKVNSGPIKETLTQEQRNIYLEPKNFWESSDPQIANISNQLQNPEKIYDFVVNKLKYSLEKIGDINNKRKGAKDSLLNPGSSLCLEFSDLFIALSRASKIPARSVEGYAFTQNSKLKPLSLSADILHAWPEYYDDSKKTWIMIDPTCGNTTDGLDYFNSFDLEHLAFVIKGKDSSYPIPAGGYKDQNSTKDINVSFATNKDFTPHESVLLKDDIPVSFTSGLPITFHVSIKNTGNTAISNKKLNVIMGDESENFQVDAIPPFGQKSYEIKFKPRSILTNKTYQVKILFAGIQVSRNIKVNIIPERILLSIGGGIFALLAGGFAIAFKTRRLSVPR